MLMILGASTGFGQEEDSPAANRLASEAANLQNKGQFSLAADVWDEYLKKEVIKYKDNMFYLTGTNVSINKGLINYDCGSSPNDFDETKFNEFCNKV